MAEQYLLKNSPPGRSTYLLLFLLLFSYGGAVVYGFITEHEASVELDKQNNALKNKTLQQSKVWKGIPDSIILVRHTKNIDTIKFIPPAEVYILAGDTIFYFPKIYAEYGLWYQVYTIRFIPQDSSGHYRILELTSDDDEYIELEDSLELRSAPLILYYIACLIGILVLRFSGIKLYRLFRDFWYYFQLRRKLRKQQLTVIPDDSLMSGMLRERYREFIKWHKVGMSLGLFSLTILYWVPQKYINFIRGKGVSGPSSTLFEDIHPLIFWGIYFSIFTYFFTSYLIRKSFYKNDLKSAQVAEGEGTILTVEETKYIDEYRIKIQSHGIVFNKTEVSANQFPNPKKGDRVNVSFYPRSLELVEVSG